MDVGASRDLILRRLVEVTADVPPRRPAAAAKATNGGCAVSPHPTQTDAAPAPEQAAAALTPLVSPNQYHLSGGGLTISYFPDGLGPIGPAGATHLVYQDAHRSLRFPANAVRTVDVPDVGTLVSVTIQESIDIGSTSFSLIVPAVHLPQGLGASAHIATDGITTTHRILAGAIGHAQTETYVVTPLAGTASRGLLPL